MQIVLAWMIDVMFCSTFKKTTNIKVTILKTLSWRRRVQYTALIFGPPFSHPTCRSHNCLHVLSSRKSKPDTRWQIANQIPKVRGLRFSQSIAVVSKYNTRHYPPKPLMTIENRPVLHARKRWWTSVVVVVVVVIIIIIITTTASTSLPIPSHVFSQSQRRPTHCSRFPPITQLLLLRRVCVCVCVCILVYVCCVPNNTKIYACI